MVTTFREIHPHVRVQSVPLSNKTETERGITKARCVEPLYDPFWLWCPYGLYQIILNQYVQNHKIKSFTWSFADFALSRKAIVHASASFKRGTMFIDWSSWKQRSTIQILLHIELWHARQLLRSQKIGKRDTKKKKKNIEAKITVIALLRASLSIP